MEKGIRIYRCFFCGSVITEFAIKDGVGCGCGSRHLRPTYPSLYEQILLVPSILYYLIKEWLYKNE